MYDIELTFLEGKDEIHVLNWGMKRVAMGISPFLQLVVGSGTMDGGEELYLIPEQQVKPLVTEDLGRAWLLSFGLFSHGRARAVE